MKKIHIGSKINLVEVPEELSIGCFKDHSTQQQKRICLDPRKYECYCAAYDEALKHAIDNPIAEFEDKETVYDLFFPIPWETIIHGIYDIPEGYRVELSYKPDPKEPRNDIEIASLVPINEEKCKYYCNCAKEAMENGANRDWVDGTQDGCPLKPKMKNIPNKLYLQIGLEDNGDTCDDFNELDTENVTWSTDKVFNDDIEYVISPDPVSAYKEELIKKITELHHENIGEISPYALEGIINLIKQP